jgi:putative Ig domain-containing protein
VLPSDAPRGHQGRSLSVRKGFTALKRFITVLGLAVVLAFLATGSASALTFTDATCDNSKPTCPLPNASADVSYQFDMFARSGCPPYHYNITGGTPVPGLTLSTVNDTASGGIGRLSGTPTTPGDYAFWVSITTPESPTCLGDRADRLFTLHVGQAPLLIKTASLRRGLVGQPYTESLAAVGQGNIQWSATGLPAGLSLSGGNITGTPTTAGDYTVTVTATNGTETKTAQYVLKVIEPLKLGVAARAAELGRPFSAAVKATGGSGNYTWTVTGLPEGLAFDQASKVISGTPTTAGVYAAKLTIADPAYGLTQDLALNLHVVPHVEVGTLRLRTGIVGQAYAFKLRAAGGVKPFTWRVIGKLPAGIKLAKTGALTGKPRAAGKFNVTLRVTDGLRASATTTFRLTVTG